MSFSLITTYSAWFFVLCVLAGAFYAILLYFQNKKFEFNTLLKSILFTLRFIAVTIIAFLLLSPLLKTYVKSIEKPVVIVALDQSQSILFNKDSIFYRTKFPEKLNKFIKKISEDYDVKTYSFNENIKDIIDYEFDGKVTDFASFFENIKTKYLYRNVGALIIASDGLYNKGRNPVYASDFINYPIYTIGLGDTSIYKDSYIYKVNFNNVAYVGNKIPVEVVVKASKCKGQSGILSISKENKQLYSKTIEFNDDKFTQTQTLLLDADKTGVMAIRVSLKPISGEHTTANNYRDIYIKVIDSRRKVLILSNSPHPDVAALKRAFDEKIGYETESILANDFNKSVSGYNLIILHQLPSDFNNMKKLFETIDNSGIPLVLIVGNQTDLRTFNNLKTGLNIELSDVLELNETQPVINNNFSLFTVDEPLKLLSQELPPLMTPFARYKVSSSAEILFYQKIGNVSTKDPLVLFTKKGQSKICIIAGEGIWKWKLYDYKINSNHNNFNEFVNKIAQYLITRQDSGLFRVYCENSFNENEPVSIDAELYNESFEMINEPEVNITISNHSTSYPFVFSRTDKSYHLDAGVFPPGSYNYEAITKTGAKQLRKTGSFVVTALSLEKISSVADHRLLRSLSEKHQGKLYYSDKLDDLKKDLNNRDDIKSVSHIEKRYNEVVNLFWLLFTVIILLSAEWFLRKRAGNY